MKTLVYITTHWTAADWHLRGQLQYMHRRGYDVILVTTGTREHLDRIAHREGVEVVGITMHREISPFRDLMSLLALMRFLAARRPDIVNASTPKAGLLGMLAAHAANIPSTVYVLRGLRLETTTGLKRAVLWMCERIAMTLADEVVCVSASLRARAIGLGLLAVEQGVVVEQGSSNGIEAARFEPTPQLLAQAESIRKELKLPDASPVIGFVGRMTQDKGIAELMEAFEHILEVVPNAYLLLIGDFESGDPVSDGVRQICAEHPQVLHTGFVEQPESYYHLMDVVAFPSFREGLPNVPLQAAAATLPVVGFTTTGTCDAIRDGETGALVPLGDVMGLVEALLLYLNDPKLRAAHGVQGHAWVRDSFRPERIWDGLIDIYESLLRA